MLENPILLKDALHNVCADSGASDDYSRGLVVGLVAGMMAVTGLSYFELVPVVRAAMPKHIDPIRLPKSFRADFTGDSDAGI